MSLLDDFAKAGKLLPASHKPVLADVADVIGAVVAHLEHGDRFLQAAEAGEDEILKLYNPEYEPPAAAAAPATPGAPPADVSALQDEISSLRVQLADAQKTQAAPAEPDADEPAPAPAAVPPAPTPPPGP